jgi:hypothetical protein
MIEHIIKQIIYASKITEVTFDFVTGFSILLGWWLLLIKMK